MSGLFVGLKFILGVYLLWFETNTTTKMTASYTFNVQYQYSTMNLQINFNEHVRHNALQF
jgi:hypothetical protein